MISVIIPVYKCEKYIGRCIESVLSQSYKDFELILVDDASPDKSFDICCDYQKKDNRVKAFSFDNAGVSENRNRGIERAKGEYICFLDSDDELEEDALRKLIDGIAEADIVIGGFTNIYADRTQQIIPDSGIYDINEFRATLFDLYKRNFINPVWGKLYKTDIIKSNEIKFPKNLSLGEDLLFVLDYLKVSSSVCLISESVYKYYRDTGSLSRSYSLKSLEAYFIQHEAMLKVLDKKDIHEENDFFIRRIWRFVSWANNVNGKSYTKLKKVFDDLHSVDRAGIISRTECRSRLAKMMKFILQGKYAVLFLLIVKIKK
ncbi:MAG: glycosyltransferase family 2 protein [Eubacterium sp.]